MLSSTTENIVIQHNYSHKEIKVKMLCHNPLAKVRYHYFGLNEDTLYLAHFVSGQAAFGCTYHSYLNNNNNNNNLNLWTLHNFHQMFVHTLNNSLKFQMLFLQIVDNWNAVTLFYDLSSSVSTIYGSKLSTLFSIRFLHDPQAVKL